MGDYHVFHRPKNVSHPTLIQTAFGFLVGLYNTVLHSNYGDNVLHPLQYLSTSHYGIKLNQDNIYL